MRNLITTFLFCVFLFSNTSFAADKDTVPMGSNKGTKMKKEFDPTEEASFIGKKEAKAKKDEDAPVPNMPYIASISTFGSPRINELILKETLGKELDNWLEKGLKGDDSSLLLEQKLSEKVKNKFGFAFAEFSVVQFFEPGDMAIHIILDVVEKADVEKRMGFTSTFSQEYKDPDNLIKAWAEYENTALDLVEAGQLQPEKETCPALHCPFGHKHEKLKKYESIFVQGVKKNQKILLDIQAKDKRGDYRAAATYLLPYLNEGKAVIPGLIERIKDVDSLVRNNALRVLGDIAEKHKEYDIPVKPLLAALLYPKTSDRSKAVYAVFHLASNSQSAREEILKSAIPSLLDLLDTKLPDQKEFSYAILRKVSGKDYTATDVQSWKNWYTRLNKERGLSNK